MRHAVLGFTLLAGVLAGALVTSQPGPTAFAQPPGKMNRDDNRLLISNVPLAGGGQQIVILDTVEKVLCCYHVKGDTGEIELKSVRSVQWDLKMDVFNSGDPKPQEIRELLNQR